jgi:hypothetical protein
VFFSSASLGISQRVRRISKRRVCALPFECATVTWYVCTRVPIYSLAWYWRILCPRLSPHYATQYSSLRTLFVQPLSLACRSYRNIQSEFTLSRLFGRIFDADPRNMCGIPGCGFARCALPLGIWGRTGAEKRAFCGDPRNYWRCRLRFRIRCSVGGWRKVVQLKVVPVGSGATVGGHHAIPCLPVVRATCFSDLAEHLSSECARHAQM